MKRERFKVGSRNFERLCAMEPVSHISKYVNENPDQVEIVLEYICMYGRVGIFVNLMLGLLNIDFRRIIDIAIMHKDNDIFSYVMRDERFRAYFEFALSSAIHFHNPTAYKMIKDYMRVNHIKSSEEKDFFEREAGYIIDELMNK